MRTFGLRLTSALILGASIYMAVILFWEPRPGNSGESLYDSLKAYFFAWLSIALRDLPPTEQEQVVADLLDTPQFELNAKLVAFMRHRQSWEWENIITKKFAFDKTGHLLDDWGNRVSFSLGIQPHKDNGGSSNMKITITGSSAGPNGVFEDGRNDDIVAVWENLLDGTPGKQQDRDAWGRKIGFWDRTGKWTSASHPFWAATFCVFGMSISALCLLIDRRLRIQEREAGSFSVEERGNYSA